MKQVMIETFVLCLALPCALAVAVWDRLRGKPCPPFPRDGQEDWQDHS